MKEVREDFPLLSRPTSSASTISSEGALSKLAQYQQNKPRDPESPDVKIGDAPCFAIFGILIISTLFFGLLAVFLGDLNALIIGVDDNGYVCGNRGRTLSTYNNAQKPTTTADLTWSKYMLLQSNDDGSMTRICVDKCPSSRSWVCSKGSANGTLTCSSSAANLTKTPVATTLGYCIGKSGREVSNFLHWTISQLSPRQLGMVINYWYIGAILASVFTIAILANVVLAFLLHWPSLSWKVWTLVLAIFYTGALVTLVLSLVFDVSNPAGLKTDIFRNETKHGKQPADIPLLLVFADYAASSTLLAIGVLIFVPIFFFIWSAALRVKDECQPVLTIIKQHLLISQTTIARLQTFTLFNSLTITVFQFFMLLLTYYIAAWLDESFAIGIFSPGNVHVGIHILVTILMTVWAVVWIAITETIISCNYLSTSAHIWHQFFERNFYYGKQSYHEHFCDLRSCFAVSQFGIALHGSLRLFSRFGRLFYFAIVVLTNRSAFGKLSEAVYTIATYYCGLGFRRSSSIFDQLTEEDSTLVEDECADTASMYSIITATSTQSVQYSLNAEPYEDHHGKLKVAEQQLQDVQNKIQDLSRKIAELAKMEEEQKRKKMQLQIIRDLAREKEKKLSEKEAEVRYVLNNLLGEFTKTKKELGEALDRQRVFEIKKMTNPPDAVKMTIEAVAFLLNEKDLDWNSLRVFIVKDSFLVSLLRLDAETVSVELCRSVREKYLSNKMFTYDKVNHASKTCGILYRWLDALSAFALERDRIKPMLSEVDSLMAELERLRSDDDSMKAELANQSAMIAATKLITMRLKKQLGKMKNDEDNLSLEKTTMERLVKEANEREPPEPVITIEHRSASAIDSAQAVREKNIIVKRLLLFIWATSAFCYVVMFALCFLSFPLTRAYLALFNGTASTNIPLFYAIPLAMVFCLVFSIVSSVVSTFEALVHTCAVAGLIHLNDPQHKKLVASCVSVDVNNFKVRLPPSIDVFVTSVLKISSSEDASSLPPYYSETIGN